MVDYARGRDAKFSCLYCGGEKFCENVPFGCFVEVSRSTGGKLSSCEVLEERPGLSDTFLKPVACPTCGCQSGLAFLGTGELVDPQT